MKKKAMKKAVNKLRKLYLKGGGTNFSSFLYKEAGLHMGTDENPYIFDPKKPRTAFTPPSSLERARTSCLENSRRPKQEKWGVATSYITNNDIRETPSEKN